jgi:hypothetical protein
MCTNMNFCQHVHQIHLTTLFPMFHAVYVNLNRVNMKNKVASFYMIKFCFKKYFGNRGL